MSFSPEFLLVLAATFVAGCVDSIVGGGGLIQTPALFGAYPTAAPATLLGTGKFAGVFGTASAALRYARRIVLPWRLLAPLVPLVIVTATLGAVVATHVPARVFRPLIPVLLILVSGYVFWHRRLGSTHAPLHLGGAQRWLPAALIGAIGFYDGFFGPGTGSFLMLVFVRCYGYDFLNAAASARVLNMATNAAALAWFATQGAVLWPLALCMAACSIAGSMVGTRLAFRGGNAFVRKVFLVIVIGLIVRTAWTAFV